jgi:hypothetical protein
VGHGFYGGGPYVRRVQAWGGSVREIRPGDTAWIPPGEKHWHGAAPTMAMVHIAIHKHLDGVHVDRLEHVTDEQYAISPEPRMIVLRLVLNSRARADTAAPSCNRRSTALR